MQIIINLISVYAQEFYDVKKDLQVCCIKFTTMYMQNEFFEWGGCIDCQGNIWLKTAAVTFSLKSKLNWGTLKLKINTEVP